MDFSKKVLVRFVYRMTKMFADQGLISTFYLCSVPRTFKRSKKKYGDGFKTGPFHPHVK